MNQCRYWSTTPIKMCILPSPISQCGGHNIRRCCHRPKAGRQNKTKTNKKVQNKKPDCEVFTSIPCYKTDSTQRKEQAKNKHQSKQSSPTRSKGEQPGRIHIQPVNVRYYCIIWRFSSVRYYCIIWRFSSPLRRGYNSVRKVCNGSNKTVRNPAQVRPE